MYPEARVLSKSCHNRVGGGGVGILRSPAWTWAVPLGDVRSLDVSVAGAELIVHPGEDPTPSCAVSYQP